MTSPVRAPSWTVRRYGRVTSTMDVAAGLLADGEVSGPTVVVADDQTAGRGRAARSWSSVPGGSIQMTAIVSVPVSGIALGPVPLLVGVAVAESLEALDGRLRPTLKWPNDVLLDGRKVAGILVVSRSSDHSSRLQIGIGVNIVEPDHSAGTTTGLAGLLANDGERPGIESIRDRLLDMILSRLGGLPGDLADDGGAAGLNRWVRRASLLGESVSVQDGDRTTEGILLGVDRTGALRIEIAPGEVITVVAGDLTRGPRPWVDDAPIGITEDRA